MKDWIPVIVQLIIAAVSIFTLYKSRAWQKADKIDAIKSTLEEHISNDAEKEAKQARRRIIDFSDECKRGIRHSEEHFNNVLDDITEYEQYCDTHPKFKNKKAEQSIKHVLEIYDKCKRENDFL